MTRNIYIDDEVRLSLSSKLHEEASAAYIEYCKTHTHGVMSRNAFIMHAYPRTIGIRAYAKLGYQEFISHFNKGNVSATFLKRTGYRDDIAVLELQKSRMAERLVSLVGDFKRAHGAKADITVLSKQLGYDLSAELAKAQLSNADYAYKFVAVTLDETGRAERYITLKAPKGYAEPKYYVRWEEEAFKAAQALKPAAVVPESLQRALG